MYQIKSHITCETSNVIYMVQCTKCNLQYIGETKRRLKERFNEHRVIGDPLSTPPATILPRSHDTLLLAIIRLIICFLYHLKIIH